MSSVRRWIFASALSVPQLTWAQTPQPPVKDQRVRVEHLCRVANAQVTGCQADRFPGVVTGRLEFVDRDTLRLLTPEGARLAFPTAFVERLLVIHGKRGHFWTGAGLGLLSGIGMGALLFSLNQPAPGSSAGVPPSLVFLAIGPPMGLLFGGVIGAGIQSDRWRAVPFEDLRIADAPRARPVGLRVSVSF